MADEDERRFERRVDGAADDSVALRALAAELDGHPAAWARMMRLRLARQIVRLRGEEAERGRLGDFWSRYGLAACDGRPLYAYGLKDAGYSRLSADVRAAAQARRLDAGFAPALFVLWASEWFRRSYRGEGERWQAIAHAVGIAEEQAFLRALSDKGLKLWRRKVRRLAGGDRRILSTLACEGGFPAAAVEEGGRGWARDMLRAIVGPLLAEPGLDFDRAVELAGAQIERLPQTFRDEQFLALCADLAIAVVRLRREAETPAAAQGIPAAAWLTINRPAWRDDLPITTEDSSATALIDLLMTVEPELVGRGAVRVERLIERTGDGWREALRLHLDGPLTGPGVADLDPGLGRLRAHAHGAFARALPGELATVEPPAIGETQWTARAIARSRGVHAVPFAAPIEFDLRAGETPVRRIALPGGAARRGALLVCTIAEAHEGLPTLLKVEASGSGGFAADIVVIQAPADWPVEANEGSEAVDLGTGVGGTRLWRITGRAWATSADGDRYLIRTGQAADAKDCIKLIGRQPGWAAVEGEPDLFCGPPLAGRSDARRGQLYLRRIGTREWRPAPSPLPVGHYEIGWREDRVLLDRRRIAVLPPTATLEQWNRGAAAAYRPDGFGTCRLVPDATAPVTVQADGGWRARRVARPTHRFGATLHWPDPAGDPPLTLTLEFPAEAAIARWDGTILPNNARFTLAELGDLVALDEGQVTMFAELVMPGESRRSETMTWRIDREMALSTAAADFASLLLPAPIDAFVRIGMADGIETFWYLAQFGPALEIEGNGLVSAQGIVAAGAEVVGRPFADPAREVRFGSYSLLDDLNHRPIMLPMLSGDWLVYLRCGERVLTRPRCHAGALSAVPARTRLGTVMMQALGYRLDGQLADYLDAAVADAGGALIAELNQLVASLDGLPPRTYRVFELAADRPALLARMALSARADERDAVLALSDALPFAWCLIPGLCWREAQGTAFQHSLALVAGAGDTAPHFAKQMVDGAVTQIIAREPLLAPILAPSPCAGDVETIVQAFLNRAHHRVAGGSGSRFRATLANKLPRYLDRFDDQFLEVLDAPFAAALAVRGEWRPDLADIRRIKALARGFPNYFGDAFALALQE